MDLLVATADLVAIPSVSQDEAALADHVEQALKAAPNLEVTRIGGNVIGRTDLGRSARLVLAGHLDTVPPNDNAQPRIDGDTLWGLGSADMKGGLAVMLALAAELADPAVDVSWVFYAGEEIARQYNGLLEIASHDSDLLRADAAILGEPTGARIEAGCQGVLKLDVELVGARAHTARPWMGRNAIHRLAPLLATISTYEPRTPVIDGCEYREALQAVSIKGGVAGNVVPDRVTIALNHRFAPDRSGAEAEAAVRTFIAADVEEGTGDSVRVTESQPAAAPSLSHPLLARLLDASGHPPRAKLGWTDVAFFAERGIPAVNFGPGDPELAHTKDERVERTDLERAYSSLKQLLT